MLDSCLAHLEDYIVTLRRLLPETVVVEWQCEAPEPVIAAVLGRPIPIRPLPEMDLADPFWHWEPLERFYPEVMDLEDLPRGVVGTGHYDLASHDVGDRFGPARGPDCLPATRHRGLHQGTGEQLAGL